MSLGWAEAAEPASQPTSIPVSSQYNSADSQRRHCACVGCRTAGWLKAVQPSRKRSSYALLQRIEQPLYWNYQYILYVIINNQF